MQNLGGILRIIIEMKAIQWVAALAVGATITRTYGVALLVVALLYPIIMWLRDHWGMRTRSIVFLLIGLYLGVAFWFITQDIEYALLWPLIIFGVGVGYFFMLGTDVYTQRILSSQFPRITLISNLLSFVAFTGLTIGATYWFEIPASYTWSAIIFYLIQGAATQLSSSYLKETGGVNKAYGNQADDLGWFGILFTFPMWIILGAFLLDGNEIALYVGTAGHLFGSWFMSIALARRAEKLTAETAGQIA